MTRNEAIIKTKKLLKLSKSPGSDEEGKNALRAAKRLMKQHGIEEKDLMLSATSAAFDDLINEIGGFVSRSKTEVPPSVANVLERLKKSVSDEEKASSIVKIQATLSFANMIWGEKSMVGDIKQVVNTVLKRYEIGE